VKDLRTGIESKEPDKVLDGALDEFVEAEIANLHEYGHE
jgi:protein subunit release factor B